MKKILILLMLLIFSFVWSATEFYSDRLGNIYEVDKAANQILVLTTVNGQLLWKNVDDLIIDDLTVDSLYVSGNTQIVGNIYLSNEGYLYARNNADSDWDLIGYYNTSDRWEWNVEQEIGNSYWGLNPGIVTMNYLTISSASPNGTKHGTVFLQAGGYNMLTGWRESDAAGDSDNPIIQIDAIVINSITSGLTASTTQSQGQIPLTTTVNVFSTVANANDATTLYIAVGGISQRIYNNGANTLQIFPASGDNLGAGVDTSTTLAAGANVTFTAIDATNWETD